MRFTKKIDLEEYGYDYVSTNKPCADYKLGQLEDIEEERGIELILLSKALQNGFYTYKGKDIVEIKSKPGNCGAMNFYASYDYIIAEDVFGQKYIYLLKEYGVTWALTREELEKTQRRK